MPQPSAASSPSGAAAITAHPGATLAPVLGAWGQSILSADMATFQHCERVGVYAVEIGKELGLGPEGLATVQVGARLHDVGKIRIPGEILHKAGRLSHDEYGIVKMHPEWGLEMLDAAACPEVVRGMVRSHHEKWDGSGYPDGLRGDEIPLPAAVICIADVFDALTSRRCYRPALPQRRALLEMYQHQEWWHPEVYAAFTRAIGGMADHRRVVHDAVPRLERRGGVIV